MSLILIGGGARSGKNRHALERARQCGSRLAFIATASAAIDDEMCRRIALHRAERGPEFTTFEEPLAVADLLSTLDRFDAVVVDCLTLYLSNHLFSNPDVIEAETARLVHAAVGLKGPVILVTNEVGCGIVPENALARQFRDLAGRLNQQAAAAAAEVYWMVFGIPMKVK